MAIYYTYGDIASKPLPNAPTARTFNEIFENKNPPRDAACVIKVTTQLQCQLSGHNAL